MLNTVGKDEGEALLVLWGPAGQGISGRWPILSC
jgi:hypothetical protein